MEKPYDSGLCGLVVVFFEISGVIAANFDRLGRESSDQARYAWKRSWHW